MSSTDGAWPAELEGFITNLNICVCVCALLQVTILDTGVRGMIAVGLVPRAYDLDHQPGWLRDSVGFHADDGKYVTSPAG